jgi:hypothetical protein
MVPPTKIPKASGPDKTFHVSTQLGAKTCEIQWDILNLKEIIRNSANFKDQLVQEITFSFNTTSGVLDSIVH